ncbi:hypothetical protein HY251_08490, partial [bacterium]|nr:hypothetical protein [bacterium]
MFDRILVPLDGSDLSARILKLVKRVLDRRSALSDEDAEVEIFRVVTEAELKEGERLGLDAIGAVRRQLADH